MGISNINIIPTNFTGALTTYVSTLGDVFVVDREYIYKLNKTDNSFTAVANQNSFQYNDVYAFSDNDYIYVMEYDSAYSTYDAEFEVFEYNTINGEIKRYRNIYSPPGTFGEDVAKCCIVDHKNKRFHLLTTQSDVTGREGYGIATFDFREKTFSNYSTTDSSKIIFNIRPIIHSYDGIYAYDYNTNGYIFRTNISNLIGDVVTMSREEFFETNATYTDTQSTLRLIENKIYMIGGSSRNSCRILDIDSGDVETVYYSGKITSFDTDFTIQNGFSAIASYTTPYLLTFDIEYFTNTYNIYNNNGRVLYNKYIGQAPIRSLRFDKDNDTISYILRTEERDITGSFTSQHPSNLNLLGMSTVAETSLVQYPFGVDINVNINNSTNFYEVYGIDTPSSSYIELYLYRNKSEPNRVDKTLYLKSVGVISGTLREETSLTDVTLTIEYSGVPNFNYVYIPIFNRYYYVVDVTSIRYNLWEITLSVDVLMTYKEGILNTTAFIERSQSLINNNLPDKKRIVEIGYDIEVIDVDSDVFVEKIDIVDFNFIINGYKLQASKIE